MMPKRGDFPPQIPGNSRLSNWPYVLGLNKRQVSVRLAACGFMELGGGRAQKDTMARGRSRSAEVDKTEADRASPLSTSGMRKGGRNRRRMAMTKFQRNARGGEPGEDHRSTQGALGARNKNS